MYKIKTQGKIGMNAACFTCGKTQPGLMAQPVVLWYKATEEKRGHNAPFCCAECAEAYRKDNNIK